MSDPSYPSSSTEKHQSTYRKHRYEEGIYRLLYDVFIAPIFMSITTLSLLVIYSLLIFSISFGAFQLTYFYTSEPNKLDLSNAISSLAVMIVAKIIGSKRVAALTGITNAITEFLLVKYGFMEDPNWIGITGASSASLIALLYWIFLEPEHKTVVKLAMDSYTGSFRPKKKE